MTELAHAAVLREAPAETDTALLARGARIVDRLNLARGGEPVEVWFVAIGDNAFALPGPRVYVGRGLFAMGDALLAFVIAHEMAHHDLGHGDARTLDQEIAADRAALELVLRAGFAESGAHDTFDLLAGVERRRGRDGDLRPVERAVARLGIGRAIAPAAARRRALWGLAAPAQTAPAPRGFAATGATVVCAACAVRFAPRPACPRCGRAELYALTDAAMRQAFLELKRWRGSAFGALVVLASLALATMWIPGAPLRTLGLLALGFWEAALVVSYVTRRVPLRPFRPRLTRAAASTTVRGTVRVVRATLSPLGTRCAAWRLRGRGPGGELDDAGVGRFEILVDDGVVARVEADDAVVDLGPDGARGERRVEGPLAAFLAERGALRDGARVKLSETVLLDGDGVEVSGVAEDTVIVEGYRGATPARLFRDWPAIRKLEPLTAAPPGAPRACRRSARSS